ncbi:uncharacterized protein LOC131060380 [Cryptomeria japonica]|uniref:uncharacterized protein LOC131060380 n=1 Tax=Cryptomeria japonica TaxID=3369 RepID=UPI0027DA75C9|nr:uncharacterized protein LOC131060380 [Cryptomeria japonica]
MIFFICCVCGWGILNGAQRRAIVRRAIHPSKWLIGVALLQRRKYCHVGLYFAVAFLYVFPLICKEVSAAPYGIQRGAQQYLGSRIALWLDRHSGIVTAKFFI